MAGIGQALRGFGKAYKKIEKKVTAPVTQAKNIKEGKKYEDLIERGVISSDVKIKDLKKLKGKK